MEAKPLQETDCETSTWYSDIFSANASVCLFSLLSFHLFVFAFCMPLRRHIQYNLCVFRLSTNLHVFPSQWLVYCLRPTHTESPWDPVGSEAKSKLMGTNLYQCILFLSDHHVSQTGAISSVLNWDLMLMRNAVYCCAEWWYPWMPY